MSIHAEAASTGSPRAIRGGNRNPRIAINIASRGRSEVLEKVVGLLGRQTLPPSHIAIACTGPDDAGTLVGRNDVTVLIEKPGLARQRNALLRRLPSDTDIVVFFDDDFVPRSDWLEAVAEIFDARPEVGCVTGHVIADGILGAGLSFEEACQAVRSDGSEGADVVIEHRTPYGCNMAYRAQAIRDLRFDERLVLYGWLEDRDFGTALAQSGWTLLKVGTARGVHMGVKTGRVAGDKLGYSQVMNPVYLNRKGTMTASAMAERLFRNIAANIVHSFAPEPFIDRRGRLRGNAIAFLDLCRGRITPERAEQL